MTKILIVDDNPQNLYLLEVLLRTNGFSVDQATNGLEALNAARKDLPDIIVTDILMPTMDGFNLCREWKKDPKLKPVPFVFYTATYTDQKDEDFALSLGAERFLKKPQNPEDFLSVVREVLAEKQTLSPQIQVSSTQTEEHDEQEYYKGYNEALVRKLEQKMLELEKSNQQLNSFYQVSCNLVKAESAKEVVQEVLKAIYEIIGYQPVAFFLFDQASLKLQVQEAMGFLEETYDQISKLISDPKQKTQALVELTALNRKTVSIPDTSKDQQWTLFNKSLKSALFIPVQYEEKSLGVLALFSNEKDAFSQNEKNIVSLANSMAISIENKHNEEKMLQLNLDLETRIQERTQQLLISNQDLEAFAYSLSHDLRAPLRAIEGYCTILVEEHRKPLNEEGVRIVDLLCQNSQRMDKFITDLLALSKVSLREKKYAKISMTDIVTDVLNEIIRAKKVRKEIVEISTLPDILGDPTLMRQVWDNLLNNAIKYSSLKENPHIAISCEEREHDYVFLVADNGIGFNPEKAKDLFMPFQRLYSDDQFEGTGIGLTIVKRIVERHNGSVWAEGKKNEGARFFFTIPRRAPSENPERAIVDNENFANSKR